jgi:hypothetical protein
MKKVPIFAALIPFPITQSFIGPDQSHHRHQFFQPLPPSSRSPVKFRTCSAVSSVNPTQSAQQTPQNAVLISPKSQMEKLRAGSSDQSKRPIYITVGPQCSGKTTILKHIFGDSFHKNEEFTVDNSTLPTGGFDIAIDDQALVYIPVPTRYFLHNLTANNATAGGFQYGLSLGTDVLGKNIQERIADRSNDELRNVIRRLGSQLSAHEFASLAREQQSQSEPNNLVAEDLIAAVEELMSSNDAGLPDRVDLFVVESIFRPRPLNLIHNITGEMPNNSTSALDAALGLLNSHASKHLTAAPIAWGNRNTRPREYTSALEAARRSGRPVEFIVFGGLEACDMIREHMSRREYRETHKDDAPEVQLSGNAEIQSKILCLPKLSRFELLKRNLQRFTRTGRYIPSAAINDAMVRVESLLASAAAEAKKTLDQDSTMTIEDAKFRLDYELTKLADFELNPDRTVISSTQTLNGRTGRDSSGQCGRGRSGRGRNNNYNVNVQGRYNQVRQNGNYHGHGRGWNNYENRGRNQAERGYNSHRYEESPYNNTYYDDRGWNSRGGRCINPNSNWQQQNHGYHSQGRGRFGGQRPHGNNYQNRNGYP